MIESILVNFIPKGSFTDSQVHDAGSTERPSGIVSRYVVHLYSLNPDISLWTKEQATSWLSNVQPLDEDDKQVWNRLKVDGKSLPVVTVEGLMRFGMTYGPALNVVTEIKKLLGQEYVGLQPSALDSMFSTFS